MTTQTINLNMIPGGVLPVVYASQYDNQVDALIFKLYNGGDVFNVPVGAAVLINGTKPPVDGEITGFSYSAASSVGNTVVCNVTQQMTAVVGDVLCELRVRMVDQIIGSVNFILRVEQSALNDDTVLSETEIPLIEQAIDIAADLEEYIQATLDAADTATAAAETAVDAADQAGVYNTNVEGIYNDLTDATAAANAAAQAAEDAADAIGNITATATTLPAGSSATASYNASTQVLSLGIPTGATGASGITTPISGFYSLYVDADGNLYVVYSATDDPPAFYYDDETGNLYVFTGSVIRESTGELITISGGVDFKVLDASTTIIPVQNLNGYDNPYPAGGGKNKFDIDTAYADTSKFTIAGNKVTAKLGDFSNVLINIPEELVGVQLTFSAKLNNVPENTNSVLTRAIVNESAINGSRVNADNTGYSSVTFTPTSTNDSVLFAYTNNGTNIITIDDIQLEVGSSRTAYAPYSNICPITGWSQAKISRTAKNILSNDVFSSDSKQGLTYTYNADGTMTVSGTASANSYAASSWVSFPIDVIVNGVPVDGSGNVINQGIYIQVYTGATGTGGDVHANDTSLVIPANTPFMIRLRINNGIAISGSVLFTPMVRVATDTDYTFEPYNDTVYTITFPDAAGTVYGGTLDVTTGVLTVTDAQIASYNGETLPSTWISDRDVYAVGTTPTTGAQVVYKLATPQTFALTPTQILPLQGVNNIWSDTGTLTLKYIEEV